MSEQLRERVRRSLLARMRERGLQPPGWLDEMAEMVVADLVESGRLGRRDVEEAVERAVDAWEDVLTFKRVAQAEGRAARSRSKGSNGSASG